MNTKEAKHLTNMLNIMCKHLYEDGDDNYTFRRDYLSEETWDLWEILANDLDETHIMLMLRENGKYPTILMDIYEDKFQDKTIANMEKRRQEIWNELNNTEDPFERIDKFYAGAREIKEWIDKYHFKELILKYDRTFFSMEACEKMFEKNMSLTDINDILPWIGKADIYGFSIKLKKPLTLSEKEREEVREDYMKTGQPKELKEIFGEVEDEE